MMIHGVDNDTVSDFLLGARYRVCRHLMMQLVVLSITVNVFWYQPLESLPFMYRFLGWLVYFFTINLVVYTNICLLVPRFLLKNRFGLYLLGALATVILSGGMTVVLFGVLFGSWMSDPAPDQFTAILNAFSGLLTFGFVTAGTAAILLFRYWIRYNRRIDELEATTLQSELKFLRNQINPHFLFNMLNNANVLIKRSPEEASKVLFKLEDLLRYQINDSSRERVSLRSDIRFLQDYLNLEKIRRDKFDFVLQEEGDIDSVWIQPLLFIPFVENAVKHNFDSENGSYVHLHFTVHDRLLNFCCENSKPAVAAGDNPVGGIGLVNIRRRLELLYPGRYLLEQMESETKYTVNLHLTL